MQLLLCEGVPIPDEKDLPRNHILKRELGFIVYDRVKNVFLGNATYIDAIWLKDYEDRWQFENNPLLSTIIIQDALFDEKKDQ